MSRALYRPSREASPEFFTSNKSFFHPKSNFHYEMSERGGRFYQKRFLLDSRKQPIRVREEEISYVLGSGAHARSYLRHHSDGRITQLPVSWYAEGKNWGMSPGYDEKWHQDFSREILHDCVFCHSSYPQLVALTASNEKLFPYELQMGIGCERCHGGGSTHLEAAEARGSAEQIQSSIFNPRRASKQLQRDLCYQCHFASGTQFARDRIYRPDKSVFAYRPGDPLSSSIINLDYAQDSRPLDEFKIAHQGYRLEQSRCFQESRGEMTCMSCHNPHESPATVEKAEFFRNKCLQCHRVEACKENGLARQGAGDNCASCHMNKRRPQDAVRTFFTDHKIQKLKSKTSGVRAVQAKPVVPRKLELVIYKNRSLSLLEEKYFLGMAYLQLPVDQLAAPNPHQRKKGVNLLEEFVKTHQHTPDKANCSAYLSRAFYLLAEAYRQSGQLDLALNSYQEALECDSTFTDGYVNLGALLAQLKKPEDAFLNFKKAISLNPQDAMAYRNLGSLYAWVGDLQQATLQFERSLKADPDNSGAYHYFGKALFMTENYEGALVAYESALDRDPRNAEIYLDCVASLLELQKVEQALKYVQAGLRYAPTHPQGLELLATIQKRVPR